MKKLLFLSVIISFFLLMLYCSKADGPPIKDGKLSVPYQTIKLTDMQIEQAGKYRYIELNVEQKKKLKKISNCDFPILLEVITIPYNDCACGLTFYGLWSKWNEVQIPNYNLKYLNNDIKEMKEIKEDEFNYYFKDFKSLEKAMYYEGLNIDVKGNIYQKGEIVNNLNKAYSNIMNNLKEDYQYKSVFVNTPPLKKKKSIETIKNVYINLKAFFEKKDYEVFAYFENEYINNEINGYDSLKKYTFEVYDKKIEDFKNGCSISCNTSWEIKASSSGNLKYISYPVSQLNDYNKKTAWVEGVPGNGINETIEFYNFRNPKKKDIIINGFLIYNGYQKSKDLFNKNSRVKTLVMYVNEKPLYLLELNDIMQAQKVSFPDLVITVNDNVKLKIVDVYGGIKYQDTAISLLLPYYEKN